MTNFSESSLEIIEAYKKFGYWSTMNGVVLNRYNHPVELKKKESKGTRQVTPTYYYVFIPRDLKNRECNPVRVHRFVAYCKYKEKALERGTLIRHKNNDSLDNSWDNLLIGTTRDNTLDIPKEIRKERALRGGVKKRKLTRNEAIEIRTMYKTGKWTHIKLAEKFNVCKRTIQMIVNEKSYTS